METKPPNPEVVINSVVKPPLNVLKIREGIAAIFKWIGEDPDREGLLDTPTRMIKSWETLYGGYKQDPKSVLARSFTEGTCDEMVVLQDIQFYSTCEHHMLPFYGVVHFGYIPNGRVVGISKIIRLVDVFARRMQIQERMTDQIVDTFNSVMNPLGCIAQVRGHHMCMSARGVERERSIMVTQAIRGAFRNAEPRSEFLGVINGKGKSF